MARAFRKGKKVIERVIDVGNKVATNIPSGMAAPGPPLGPMLGQKNINIAAFCKDFNERTKEMKPGIPLPCKITVRPDRSYDLVIHMPPVVYYVKQAAGIQRGAMMSDREVVGKITLKHVYEIAKIKRADPSLEITPLETICKMVIHAARSVGIQVVPRLDPEEYGNFLKERKRITEGQLKALEEKRLSKMLRTV